MLHTAVKRVLNSMRNLKLAHILVPDIHGHTHFFGQNEISFSKVEEQIVRRTGILLVRAILSPRTIQLP